MNESRMAGRKNQSSNEKSFDNFSRDLQHEKFVLYFNKTYDLLLGYSMWNVNRYHEKVTWWDEMSAIIVILLDESHPNCDFSARPFLLKIHKELLK